MRAEDWKGLITNASPYALPPGGATEQVNLQTHIPGQLTSRGGMWPVTFSGVGSGEVLDLYPYSFNGQSKLITLKPGGVVDVLDSPAAGAAPTAPVLAAMSPGAGQVQSNYAGQFYAYGGEPPA